MAKNGENTIASVDKALAILDLFSEQTPELGITEMTQLIGLHKSTLAGLVYTLERNGYLSQNSETRKYRLGLRLAERAAIALQQFEVVRLAQRHMEALVAHRNESVNFAVLEGTEVVYLAHVSSTQLLGVRVKIGKRASPHSTALGKAMLSKMPEPRRMRILENLHLEPLTPFTITSLPKLIAELDECARQGYALDNEENELGGRCVAAAVLDWTGQVAGAVSMSVPIPRFPVERIPEYSADIIQTARDISLAMGWRG
jgi:IclR family transcriptional regulator, KDG regulon repressor